MKLVCPNCKKEYTLTKDTPGVSKNISGEYYYVCQDESYPFAEQKPYYKRPCGGYMIVDYEALCKEEKEEDK